MSTRFRGTERAAILWLSGMCLTDIYELPEVQWLLEKGSMIELDPLPITGLRTQHYQVMSGRQPGNFGFFDTLVPRNYSVVEEYIARDANCKLLPDVLRMANWTVHYEEMRISELVNSVSGATKALSTPLSCLIVKCAVQEHIDETASIAQALQTASTWVGESGLLVLLSDTKSAAVHRFVNLNNILAEMGLIDRDQRSGLIDWSSSLAYHIGHGQLWLNQLGREPRGVVHPQNEYEEVRDILVKMLPDKCRDTETGELVIEQVCRKEDLYSKEYLFCAPDLVVLFKSGYAPSLNSSQLQFDETVFSMPMARTKSIAGIHPSMLTGFLLVSSPTFAQGVSVSEHAPLTSVAPTLLHSLEIKQPPMDSSAISALFSPTYLGIHPISENVRDQELSEEEEEIVIGRLRDLGYL